MTLDRPSRVGGQKIEALGPNLESDSRLVAGSDNESDTAVLEFGGFDTWVNNAGVGIFGRIEDAPAEDMRKLFDTNFWGVVYGSLEAVKVLRQRGGALINVGSVVSDRAAPLLGIYAASKHAVKAFTDSLRMELEAESAPVSVTLIKPGSTDTPFSVNAQNYAGQEWRLPPPVYVPDCVAEAILHAARHPKRDIVVGGGGKMMSSASLAPRLTDKIMETDGFIEIQKMDRPASMTNALDGPSERLAERGNYDGHVMRTSLYTKAALEPLAATMAVVGLGIAMAALWRSSHSDGANAEVAHPARILQKTASAE